MEWKLIIFIGILVGGVIVVGGFLYYQGYNGIIIFNIGSQSIGGINSQVLTENISPNFIGVSGIGWSFDIQEDTKQEVSVEIVAIDKSTIELTLFEHPNSTTNNSYQWNMALCNTEGAGLEYENERTEGGFDNTEKLTPTYDTLTRHGLNETWCGGGDGYILFLGEGKNQFPKTFRILTGNMTEFTLYAGTGSVVIDGAAGEVASAGIGDNICRDSSGVLHVAYEGAANDLWYGNSTDNGVTWSIKELLAGTSANVDITCGITNNITILFETGLDVDGFESGNNGETFGSVFSAFDTTSNLGPVNCAVDLNDVVHCVGADADVIYYTNSSAWNTLILLAGQTSNNTDHGSIEVDSSGNIYIIGAGTDNDNADIWSSIDGWASRNIIDASLGAVRAASSFGFAIDTDGRINYAGDHGFGDLQYCNGTIANWNGGASAYTCQELSPTESRDSDFGISQAGDIFIIHSTDIAASASTILRSNSTDGFVTFESRTELHPVSAAEPSVANSFYPTSNRPDDMLRYVFSNASGFYFNNFTIRTSAATGNKLIIESGKSIFESGKIIWELTLSLRGFFNE